MTSPYGYVPSQTIEIKKLICLFSYLNLSAPISPLCKTNTKKKDTGNKVKKGSAEELFVKLIY